MKIGVLTFGYTVNYGAELQAYALVRSLNNINNIEAELINYKCNRIFMRNVPMLWEKGKRGKVVRNIIAWKSAKKRWDRFRDFEELYIPSSKIQYSDPIIIDEKKYDRFIIGSDQVWNMNLTNGDSNFFLPTVRDRNKIFTYAASFGYSIVPQKYIEKTKKGLLSLKNYTVREKSGADIIFELCKKKAEIVVDPTFLLSKDEWNRFIIENSTNKIVNKKYILLYLVKPDDMEMWNFVEKYSKINNLEIIWITPRRNINKPGKKIRSAGPIEFLNLIKTADVIITGSFHAVCFSLQFSKRFIYIIKDEKKSSRVMNLIEILGISQVIFQKNQQDIPVIDYTSVQNKIEKMRNHSLEILNDIVNIKI